MALLETYGKEIVALLAPVITWLLNTVFRTRSRLYLANPHSFTFLVPIPLLNPQGQQISPTQTVHTASFMLWNGGRETATKVEWVFDWKPPCLNVWPARHYVVYTETDGRSVIVFESLAPHEYVGCELMSINAALPNLLTVRSDQCVAQNVNMYPQPVVSNLQRRVYAFLRLAGIALIVYLAILLVQFLVLKTPVGP
jgi:hypothetical protein